MSTTTLKLRRLAACAASLTVAAVFFHIFSDDDTRTSERLFADSVIAVPVVAAALIWSGHLVAQLLARGTWWSLLLVGGLMALIGDREGRHLGAYIAMCNAGALLVVGSSSLDSRGRFAPVAFRGTLLVALVLAIADTGAFLWFGTGSMMFEGRYSCLLLVPLMITGVIGLLRLRTWGLMVSLFTNLLIAILAIAGVLFLPGPLRGLFVGTAVLQMLVPIPMVIAIVRGRTPSPDAWRRTKIVVPAIAIAGVAAFSVYAAFIHHGTLLRF